MSLDWTDRPTDHAGSKVLGLADCHVCLRGRTIGRIGFLRAGAVEIFPVNYGLVGSTIVFKTSDGTKLGAVLDLAPVTFEIDGVGPPATAGTAWSVVVKGVAGPVGDGFTAADLDSGPAAPLLPSAAAQGRWVAIRADEISGRALLAVPT
ncbi:pyridoxamine 5'-phosphate oxidase family protein [Cryptosporangium sp. NPDC051539]|uniref:pyridoxamine 5'-phosphate oxidase family protein n=1 Tax=Cryptosporangium sp. NPDC051539 TaxID=3363962 RepID=UPI0037A921A0